MVVKISVAFLDVQSDLGKRKQQPHETVENFAKALKALARECGKENEDKQIAEHFVNNMTLSAEFKKWSKFQGHEGKLNFETIVSLASAMEYIDKNREKSDSSSIVIKNCNTAHLHGTQNHYDYRGDTTESKSLNSEETSSLLSTIDKELNRMSISGNLKEVLDEIDHWDRQNPHGTYMCKGCNAEITAYQNRISVPDYESYGVKMNPAGFVFQTITCSSMKSIKEVTERTSEHTWFKGYAWTIVCCVNCKKHMGWKYYKESGEGKLDTFYCLIITAVVTPRRKIGVSSDVDFCVS